MKAAKCIVKALEKAKVSVVFGIPGRWVLPIYEALRSSKIRHVLMRDERGASYAAYGYAKARKWVGVCLSTAGPGALNALPGIVAAYRDHIPVTLISGQVSEENVEASVEYVDALSIYRHVTKAALKISLAETPSNTVLKALSSSLTPPTGPSYVEASLGLQLSEIKNCKTDFQLITIKNNTLCEEDVTQVVKLLNKAKRPLILAGHGVILAKAHKSLQSFSIKYGIPVVTSLLGRGALSEYSNLNLGWIGLRGNEQANLALSQCDVLIILGCRLSDLTITSRNILVGKRIVHVELDERNFYDKADLKIKADVKAFLECLLKHMKGFTKKPLWFKKKRVEYAYKGVMSKALKSVFKHVRKGFFTIDIGQHAILALTLAKVSHKKSLIIPGGLAPMGFAIPAAIGACLVKKGVEVVALVGDGGFQMSCSELATISQLNLPIKIVLFNNRGLGLIRQQQEAFYGVSYETSFKDVDYVKLAESFGIESVKAEKPEDVGRLIEENRGQPFLVEVDVDPRETVPLKRRLE